MFDGHRPLVVGADTALPRPSSARRFTLPPPMQLPRWIGRRGAYCGARVLTPPCQPEPARTVTPLQSLPVTGTLLPTTIAVRKNGGLGQVARSSYLRSST